MKLELSAPHPPSGGAPMGHIFYPNTVLPNDDISQVSQNQMKTVDRGGVFFSELLKMNDDNGVQLRVYGGWLDHFIVINFS